MNIKKSVLILLALFSTPLENRSAHADAPRLVDTEIKLDGACRQIFGRSRIALDSVPDLPIAPFNHDAYETGVCVVTLKYTDQKTSKPLEGVTVDVDRLLTTDSFGTKEKRLGSPKTNKDGVVKIRFKWDPESCGVTLNPNKDGEYFIGTFATLLTERAFLQIKNCQGTFIGEGLSREDICNGEPKN